MFEENSSFLFKERPISLKDQIVFRFLFPTLQWCFYVVSRNESHMVAIDHRSCFFRPFSALTHTRDTVASADILALEREYSHSSHCLCSGWSFIYPASGRVAGGLAVLRFHYLSTRHIRDKSNGDARHDGSHTHSVIDIII